MSTAEIISLNPATKKIIGTVKSDSVESLNEALKRARSAKGSWADLRLSQRARILRMVRKTLVKHTEELSELIAAETGKTHWEGFLEVFTTCEHLRHIAKHGPEYLRTEIRSSGIFQNKKCYVNYVPHGVVGIISPWNYPLILTASPVVEALMAGNAVVLKPSELTPLTGKRMVEIFHQGGIPEQVLQIVQGGGEIGAELVSNPLTDMVCFTGSVEVGKKIALACAEHLKPVILELGGKDPMIVLEDADLEKAAGAAVWGGFSNCGQTCISVERVFVAESVADEFIAIVKQKTEALSVGPDKINNDIGAVINEKQQELILGHIQSAVSRGAKIISGGNSMSDLGGYFIKPTVLEVFEESSDIMTRETFGPEICIMRVKDENEAIQKANQSLYGLSASVFTKNKKRGQEIARKIRAGSICINDVLTNYISADLPFGGMGISGIGRVHGPEGLRGFSQAQSILVDRWGLKKELWWYPVHAGVKKWFQIIFRWFYG